MILRFLYKRFTKEFNNLMVEDLLMNIPNKVGRPAIEIVSSKREPVIKWLYYEANAVSRRVPTDFGNLERRNGILIMIQAFITALATSGFPDEPKVVITEKTKETVDWRKGINEFKGHKVAVDK